VNPLERVRIGRTDVSVTRLGMGTSCLGELFQAVSEDAAIATVHTALGLGVNLFDTAPLYGHTKAEMRLGKALAEVPRDSYVLATKVGRLLVPAEDPDSTWFVNLPPFAPVFDFSYDGVMRSFESSLKRLGLDRIDIVHIHDPEEEGAFEQAMVGAYPALAKLRAEGVIRAVSVGVGDAALLVRFAKAGDFDCFLMAGRYTLLDHRALAELLPTCERKGISIIVGGPYNSGILATGARAGAKFDYAEPPEGVRSRVAAIEAVCARYSVPLPAAALQFCAAHPAVASVIPGAKSAEEIDRNFRMFAHPIPAGLWTELKQLGYVPREAPVPGAGETAVHGD
jgi:D-threo-aldose 1-dehydrogenase